MLRLPIRSCFHLNSNFSLSQEPRQKRKRQGRIYVSHGGEKIWISCSRGKILLLLPREQKIRIFELTCSLFFLLYKHTDDGVFDHSPEDITTTFRRFPKIFQNCSEGQTNVPKHFPKMSEDFRGLPKTAEDFRGRLENVSRWYLHYLAKLSCPAETTW